MRKLSHKAVGSFALKERKHVNTYLTQAILTALLLSGSGLIYAQTASPNDSKDPKTWVDEEFNTDNGLATINAQHAYARGLSGKGILIGIMDSGVATSDSEFTGKTLHSIDSGDKFRDGSICTNTRLLTDDACFYASGNDVAVDYMDYDSAAWQSLVDKGYISDELRQTIFTEVSGARYNTHGTHVAGTMVANRDGTGSQGVAFGANLSTARIFSNTYTNTADFVEDIGGNPAAMGIQEKPEDLSINPTISTLAENYEIMQQQGVRAINNSWGLFNDPTSAQGMDALYAEKNNDNHLRVYTRPSSSGHIIQVWAAGNNHGNIAGLLPSLPRYIPEAEPYWLSVVNVNSSLSIAESSSTCGLSKNWCVAAPGTMITSSVLTSQANAAPVRNDKNEVVGLEIGHSIPQFGYGDMSGTSMAAPHVTGSLALLMERFPYLDNAQIRDILLTTATDIGDPGIDDKYGWGLINLQKAINGPGMLRSDVHVTLDQHPGGTLPDDPSIWDDWSNNISGPGRLFKSGQGFLRLSGNNTFAGIDIQEGGLGLTGNNTFTGNIIVEKNTLFKLDGQLSGTNIVINQGTAEINGVMANGMAMVGVGSLLHGNGTLGNTVVNGVISPGNSIGKMTIDGNYTQSSTGVYLAEISDNNESDKLIVSGVAKLDGTLKVVATEGASIFDSSYQFLTAAQGVQGSFTTIDTSSLSPFMALKVSYAPNSVNFTVGRGSQVTLQGETSNQSAVSSLIDKLPNSHFLVKKLTTLKPTNALRFMDSLSGEIYASLPTVLAEQSRVVRDTALEHARIHSVESVTDGRESEGVRAWARMEHTSQQIKKGNRHDQSFPVHTQESIPFVGVDFLWHNAYRIGGIAGSGHSTVQINPLESKSKVKANYFGAYFSRQWDRWGLIGGLAQAAQTLDTHRQVALDRQTLLGLGAKNDATTRQFFFEANTQYPVGRGAVEPFAQFAQVRVAAKKIEETGGIARLLVERQTENTHVETLGFRFNSHFTDQSSDRWIISGALAYRHTDGDIMSKAKVAFSDTQTFRIIGTNQGHNATVGDLGLTFFTTPHSQLKLGYTVIFSDRLKESEGYLDFSMTF